MATRSSVYDGIDEETLTIRKGLVERLRDRRRYLTREACRSILDSLGWDLEEALRITYLITKHRRRQ